MSPPTTQAEVPGCLWLPADRSNYRFRPINIIGYDLIVIHITSGHPDAHGTAEMWQKPFHGSSAHFVIGQDGTAIQCVALRFAAQHAHDANGRSVGIEHSAREPREFGPADPGLRPSDALYEASARLVAYLLKAAGLPVDREHVKGHAEADPKTKHTGCPNAAGWDWPRYMARVQAAYDQIGEPPLVA